MNLGFRWGRRRVVMRFRRWLVCLTVRLGLMGNVLITLMMVTCRNVRLFALILLIRMVTVGLMITLRWLIRKVMRGPVLRCLRNRGRRPRLCLCRLGRKFLVWLMVLPCVLLRICTRGRCLCPICRRRGVICL